MQIRSQSLLWSKPPYLPQSAPWPTRSWRAWLLPPTVLFSYQTLYHLLHPRHNDNIALSQNAYFSHHDLCTWCSFCLECFSLRSLISWKFLLNSQLSLPFSKVIPWPLTPITIYCLSLFSFFTGCFLLPSFLLQVYSCLYFSSPSRKCKLHESMDLVGQVLCWPRRIPGPRITFQP